MERPLPKNAEINNPSPRNILFTITTKRRIRGKEVDFPTLEIEVKGSRMFARTLGNDSVSARLDVTPLWNMFKEVIDYKEGRLDVDEV